MSELFELGKDKYSSTRHSPEKKETIMEKLDNKEILKCFYEASQKLSPLWDIRDYVAVNPFFGFKEQKFLDTAKYIENSSGRSILPQRSYFLERFNAGLVTKSHLVNALNVYNRSRTPKKEMTVNSLISFIKNGDTNPKVNVITNKCLSDVLDSKGDCDLTGFITKEISRWASAYFDEGQALWKVSTKDKGIYSWWKSLVIFDNTQENLGVNFSTLVENLPEDSENALKELTSRLIENVNLSTLELTNYYYRLIYTVMGWASYVQKYEFEANRSGDKTELIKIGGLIDILVIRLAYDISLLDKGIDFNELHPCQDLTDKELDLDYLYIWMTATEFSTRESIANVIDRSKDREVDSSRPDVQMAFCIDVRSEILRRKLEDRSPKIQTIGFAGFFGMPISLKGLGHNTSDQNCPILLNSAFEIEETSSLDTELLKNKKQTFANNVHFKKTIQSSANSGFSFVETFGFSYIKKIISAGLGKNKPNIDMTSMGLSENEKSHLHLNTNSLTLESKLALVKGALKNMGLTKNFAKFVLFIGHGSESSNNPYSSALDCGACAGHNGLGNASMLASLLNDSIVREELGKVGINIPSDTIFISGWHNTTTDKISIDQRVELTEEQDKEIQKYGKLFDEASLKCSEERAQNLPMCSHLKGHELVTELNLRANDWSEIRPEWGLARNTSFIVGRRSLTRNLSLDGRSFLHDYDERDDEDLSILELIMTAPMIVTNWINMQYYASTVDPQKFGAGSKVLNNVVGGIGCIQGNESDLVGGLTEQSVWYQGKYFHEPIRLQVFIEAKTSSIDKIINKHKLVKDLVGNNWLHITSIDPVTGDFKLYELGQWS